MKWNGNHVFPLQEYIIIAILEKSTKVREVRLYDSGKHVNADFLDKNLNQDSLQNFFF